MPDNDLVGTIVLAADFEGIGFPVTTCPFEGGHRGTEHEANGRKGADCESTGQLPYRGTLGIPCVEGLRGHPTALTETYRELIAKMETTPIGSFTHPVLGGMQAWFKHWHVVPDANSRNGWQLEVTWTEHNGSASGLSLDNVALPTDSPSAATSQAATADEAMAATGTPAYSAAAPTGYSPVASTVTAQLDVLESAERSYAEIGAAINAMLAPVARNLALAAFAAAPAHPAVAALERLRALVYALRDRYLARFARAGTYTVPTDMPLWQAALAIYGDAGRASDLAAINTVPDWLFVRAGTVLQIVPAATGDGG